jgi:Cu/Ag efflux protein CusF
MKTETEIHMQAKHTLALAVVLLASAVGAQQAPQPADHTSHHPPGAAAAAPRSEGEVRKVDLEQGKVTLRHGPLTNLDMPAMTMVFTAADPKLLEGLKQGDKVRFTADNKDGTYIVTAMEAVK